MIANILIGTWLGVFLVAVLWAVIVVAALAGKDENGDRPIRRFVSAKTSIRILAIFWAAMLAGVVLLAVLLLVVVGVL